MSEKYVQLNDFKKKLKKKHLQKSTTFAWFPVLVFRISGIYYTIQNFQNFNNHNSWHTILNSLALGKWRDFAYFIKLHCKFKEHCEKQHGKGECKYLLACKSKTCNKRHPKVCRRYSLEKYCSVLASCFLFICIFSVPLMQVPEYSLGRASRGDV